LTVKSLSRDVAARNLAHR